MSESNCITVCYARVATASLNPVEGGTAGGTRVTVTGHGFASPDLQVTVGGNVATIDVTSITNMMVRHTFDLFCMCQQINALYKSVVMLMKFNIYWFLDKD